jgi:hypothetical protein
MKKYLSLIGIITVLVFLLIPFMNVNAQFLGEGCDPDSSSLEDCIDKNIIAVGGFFGDPNVDLPKFIGNLIKFGLTLVGSIFLLLIIYAGFQWMTAGGNTDQTKKAAQTMRNSVIGLIIIILAYAITITIFNVILGATTSP